MKEIPLSTLKVFGIQSILLNEISRCILYSREMPKPDTTADKFIKTSLLKQSIIVWCQVFGSRGVNNPCHWSKVSSKQNVIRPFDRDCILKALNVSLDEWSQYHLDLKRLRDKFIAHYDLDSDTDHFPNMDMALGVVEAYRDWMYEMLAEYQKHFPVSVGFFDTKEFNSMVEREWNEKT